MRDHNISEVRNCFLMPTEQDTIIDKGYVSMSMLDDLGLRSIQVRFLPAASMYVHYLNGTKLDIRELNL